jgi:hypothetical protein
MKFYTYAYLREDKTPYYIGKGSNGRIYAKQDRVVPPPSDKSRIIYLKQNLSEEEAFRHEVYLIALYGRKDLGTGILHNRTDGGDGSSNPSQETRDKISAANKQTKRTPESNAKRSAALKGKKRNPLSPEHRAKQSAALKGRKHSPDHIAKRSASKKRNHAEKKNRECANTQTGTGSLDTALFLC